MADSAPPSANGQEREAAPNEPERTAEIPPLLPVLPMRVRVVFPLTLAPAAVSEPPSVQLLEDVMRTHRMVAAVATRGEDMPSSPGDLYEVGCAATILQLARAPDGSYHVAIQGLERIRISGFVQTEPYLVARVERAPWVHTPGNQIEALARTVRELFRRIVELTDLPEQLAAGAAGLEDPRALAYLVATTAPLGKPARQEILEAGSTLSLLRRVVEGLQQEIAVRQEQERITDEKIDRPGIATGLAWTPAGGDVLFVEAAMMRGRPALVLTGMLGDVMRESAQAALTYVRSNAERLGCDPTAFDRRALHVHVPAGAIPKDGPSAGVALMTAIASAARGVPVRSDVAMTGEITLRGTVLPVGGIKEKVLAAFRAGVRTVILPRRNEADLEDVPEEARRALRFVLVDSADEVLPVALEGAAPTERAEERAAETAAVPVH